MVSDNEQPYPVSDVATEHIDRPEAPPPQMPMYPPHGYYPWMPMPYMPRPPRPKGTPKKSLFQVGAAGLFMTAGSGIACGALYLIRSFSYYSSSTYPWHVPAIGALMFISLIVSSAGYFGLYRNYGSGFGLGTAIYMVIAACIFLSMMVASISYHSYSDYYYYENNGYYNTDTEVQWAGYAVLGVAPILMGISHILSRFHLTLHGLGIAVGVLLIIAGSFQITMFLSFVGFFVMTAGAICGGVNFARAPVYSEKELGNWMLPMPYMMPMPPMDPRMMGNMPQYYPPPAGQIPGPAYGRAPPRRPY
jgi:hypothetical protein